MQLSQIPSVLLLSAFALTGCNSGTSQSKGTRFDPPSTQFADQLGIATPPPVTSDQAMAIAAEAAGGTAVGVDQEQEGGQLLYEVKVETASGRMEVEVRASDGGVVEIEPDDD
jgi:uncharacterized membrane protein YkoI